MRKRVRQNVVANPIQLGTYTAKYIPSGYTQILPQSYYDVTRMYDDVEVTLDELHPGPPYRTGGPFDNWKAHDGGLAISDYSVIYREANNWQYTYRGFFIQLRPQIQHYLSSLKDETSTAWATRNINSISPYGPTGWKMYQPLKPVVDVGQDLYELREIPKMLANTKSFVKEVVRAISGKNTKIGSPKFASQQWLNLNFGWAPLVSSIIKLVKYQDKCSKRYQWLVANNGLWRRRGGVVLEETSSNLISSTGYPTSGVYPKPSTALYATDYQTRIWNRLYLDYKRKIWFEGAFRYYIPDIGTYDDWSKDYFARLGLTPSPKLVWELTPWSWLIDWFTNFGDVIENLQNAVANPVVAKYAYIMGDTQSVYRYETLFPFYGKDVILNRTYPCRRKQRVGANPFGFGITDSSLTAFQWSILAALGISKIH